MSENLSGPPEAPNPTPAPSSEPAAPPLAEAAPANTPEGDAAATPLDGERRRRRRRRRGRRGGVGGSEGEGQAASEGEGAGSAGVSAAGASQRPPREPREPRPPREARGGERERRGGRRDPRRREHVRQQSEHHALQALRAFSTMAEGLLEVEGIEPLARPRYLEIKVQVPLDLKRDGMRAAANAVREILQRVGEVREHEKALKPGAVFCYFSQSAEADTSRPSEVSHVFEGYASTGKPSFVDFLTTAIERKYPNYERLAAGEDVVVTHATMGRVLRTQQLVEFGKTSPVYKILGQVDAGLFPLVNSDKKAAFSFQLLRGTTLEGRPRLRVHVVGAADLLDLADQDVALIVSRFQRHLDQESLRLAGQQANGETQGEEAEEAFVLPLLQELARQIAGNARRAQRRTEHAEQRTNERQRPTSKAFEDARDAGDRDLLWDDVEGTVIVLGAKNRVHVFSKAAIHVTSLVMDGAAIQGRVKQGRWREAEPEERGSFRIHMKRRLEQGAGAAPEAALPGATPEPPALP